MLGVGRSAFVASAGPRGPEARVHPDEARDLLGPAPSVQTMSASLGSDVRPTSPVSGSSSRRDGPALEAVVAFVAHTERDSWTVVGPKNAWATVF